MSQFFKTPANPDTGEIEFPEADQPFVFLNADGQEVPNPEPIVIHLGGTTVNDYDRVREIIRRELSIQMAQEGMETEDEANDFEVEDDLFPVGAAEYDEGTEAADREAMQLEAQLEKERSSKRKKSKPAPPVGDTSEPVQGSAPPDESEAP